MTVTEQQRKTTAAWIEALRSGNYPQTKNCLRNNAGFCCLGVLGDVVANEKDIGWGSQTEEDCEEIPLVVDGKTYEADLPHAMFERWTGLGGEFILPKDVEVIAAEEIPLKPSPKHPVTAFIEMNDDYKADFDEIADLVEAVAKAQGVLV